MNYANPWREMLVDNTDRIYFSKRNYKACGLPINYQRAIYTKQPARHTYGDVNSLVMYTDRLHVVIVDDNCAWDEFVSKHDGEDVIALAEFKLDK